MRAGSVRSVAVSAAVAVAVAASCSLPVDERVTPIDQDQFGAQLTEETTTTTVAPTTTTTPSVDEPDEPGASSTTIAAIETQTIIAFYTRGFTDVMQSVEFQLAGDTPVLELIPLLERPPTQVTQADFRSSVRPGLVDDIVVDRGIGTVVLDPTIVDRMSNSELQRAIAQIVLTLTSFVTPDSGAIGFARFEADGDGFPVYVPAFGGSSEPGEPLAFLDFARLISTTPTPTTTTTTTVDPGDAPETSDGPTTTAVADDQ